VGEGDKTGYKYCSKKSEEVEVNKDLFAEEVGKDFLKIKTLKEAPAALTLGTTKGAQGTPLRSAHPSNAKIA
jgi:hypothetical protein